MTLIRRTTPLGEQIAARQMVRHLVRPSQNLRAERAQAVTQPAKSPEMVSVKVEQGSR
jgi:hypothetical protein